MTVLGLEDAGRNACRMIVAGLLGDFVHLQPARGLEVEHENLCLQQRGVHPLALARRLPFEQRHHDTERAEQTRG